MVRNKPLIVCLISSLHSLYDDRIYWKQALSLKKAGYNVIHIGIGNNDKDFFSEHGIRLIEIKKKTYSNNLLLNRLIKWFDSKNEYSRLFEYTAKIGADIYHIHDFQLNCIVGKIKKLPNRPKLIYDVHEPNSIAIADGEYSGIIKKPLMKLYSLYIHYRELIWAGRYDLIIATEENVANYFNRYNSKYTVDIIYNYSNWGYPDLAKIHSGSKRKKYDFIYTGAIRRRRGAIEMLQAMAELKKRGLRVTLLVVGTFFDQDLESEMQHFIVNHQLEQYVSLRRSVPYQEVMQLYASSTCGLALFNSKKVNKTIMPIKIFEYIAFGLPVVCSNIGHMESITQKYKTGITVSYNQIDEIVDAMQELVLNEQLCRKYSDNCKRIFDAEMNWGVMEKKLLDLYQVLLSD